MEVHYIGVLFHTFTFVYLPVDMVDLHSAHHSSDTQCSARVLHYRALHTNTHIISSSPGGNICFFVPKKIRETWSESSLWHGESLTKVWKKFCAFVVGLRTKLVNMQYLANTSGSRCSFAKELSLCDRRGKDGKGRKKGRISGSVNSSLRIYRAIF